MMTDSRTVSRISRLRTSYSVTTIIALFLLTAMQVRAEFVDTIVLSPTIASFSDPNSARRLSIWETMIRTRST